MVRWRNLYFIFPEGKISQGILAGISPNSHIFLRSVCMQSFLFSSLQIMNKCTSSLQMDTLHFLFWLFCCYLIFCFRKSFPPVGKLGMIFNMSYFIIHCLEFSQCICREYLLYVRQCVLCVMMNKVHFFVLEEFTA